jgi:hypothetical protein
MTNTPKYSFDEHLRFVIEDYNWSKPLSSFFPGIAGKWGIPLWIYYVNRGQAIISVGSQDKDGAILEFQSFNRACQLVSQQGFRTFLRINENPVYEPFQKVRNPNISQRLFITSHELTILERNDDLNLEIQVRYYPLVQEPLSGLVRHVRIANCGEAALDIQLIDGVPRLLPYGVKFDHVKVSPRHIEGMMGVSEVEGIPIFRLKQTPADRSEIGELEAFNYYFTCFEDGSLAQQYLIDPEVLFGAPNDFSFPWNFDIEPLDALLSENQMCENRTPCAFTPFRREIVPDEEISFYSVIGHASKEGPFRQLLPRINAEFLQTKRMENNELIQRIKNTAFTASSTPLFDHYCQETFLENVMRGGMPTSFDDEGKSHVFYMYSRQNGDLERDYHWFMLEPTYLSQGNGHFRSICQNRRMDTWFFPEIGDFNIFMFTNLIQTDGYNPLVVNGQRYIAHHPEALKVYLETLLSDALLVEELIVNISKPFTPGELILWIEGHCPKTERAYETILAKVLPHCRKLEVGDIHEGFWVDHWIYLIDLLEIFLTIYPDRLKEILWERGEYSFYDNPDIVQPRSRKIVFQNGLARQYGAVSRDAEKEALIGSRKADQTRVRTRNGKGDIYKTNLLVKLICVLACKISTLDPFGIGLEMEADKPGWNDSMNGLPGLFGSSLCQSLELLRAFRFLEDELSKLSLPKTDTYPVYRELATYLRSLIHSLNEDVRLDEQANLKKWDELHGLLEAYRSKTRLGIDGREEDFSVAEFFEFIKSGRNRLEKLFSILPPDRLFNSEGVPYTYFINDIVEHEVREPERSQSVDDTQGHLINPTLFQQRPTALFLEGPMHYIKVFPERGNEVLKAVRRSKIFDPKLGMYKSCESLQDQPLDIGRIKAYTSGWIENESIYTHMEYKWLLEVLRSGNYDPFFEDMQNALPPFMSPEVYGRSTLENCSFIVSSAYPDPKLHGQAFQPRLSGVTAEMLEIWALMTAGPKPFRLDQEGNLQLSLDPKLPEWLFTHEGETYRYWDRVDGWKDIFIPRDAFAFRFLGQTLVVYHNPNRKPSFGLEGARVTRCDFIFRDTSTQQVVGNTFNTELALAVREGLVTRMNVRLA